MDKDFNDYGIPDEDYEQDFVEYCKRKSRYHSDMAVYFEKKIAAIEEKK